MYKLVNIANGKSTAEIEPVEISHAFEFSPGKAGKLNGGVLISVPPYTHIVCSKQFNDKAYAYRITHDMRFRVPLAEAPTTLAVGDKVATNYDGQDVSKYTSEAAGYAIVVDLCQATKAGDEIVVAFE